MIELTQEDREKIQNQIIAYKVQPPVEEKPTVAVPMTPDGQNANQALDEALKSQSTPDNQEEKRVKKRIKGIWRNWRTTALDAKSLEIEKIACQIELERAETRAKLTNIKRQQKEEADAHWLRLNKGNLEEIDANTESKPSMFWYSFRRGFHHIAKLTGNIPKIIKNLFWIGVVIIGLVVLKQFDVL